MSWVVRCHDLRQRIAEVIVKASMSAMTQDGCSPVGLENTVSCSKNFACTE